MKCIRCTKEKGYFLGGTVCIDCLEDDDLKHEADGFGDLPASLTLKTFRRCLSCEATKTPLWRKADWYGYRWKACNACGLKYNKGRSCVKCWRTNCDTTSHHPQDQEVYGNLLQLVADDGDLFYAHKCCV